MVTLDELRKLDISKLKAAAKAWGAVSNRSSDARRRVDSHMVARVRDTQEGDAAKAAARSAGELSLNFQYIHAECGLIQTALNGLAEEVAGPQTKLKQALEDAENLKFKVGSDGSVEYPRASFDVLPSPALQQPARSGDLMVTQAKNPNEARAKEIAERIGSALKEANEIDGRYSRALLKLNTNGKLDQTDWSDVAKDLKDVRSAAGGHFSDSRVPKGKTPQENAAWWKGLTQAERDEYSALYPAGIGALDGLPASVRDDANRIVLAESREDIIKKLKEMDAHPLKEGPPELNPVTGLPKQGKESEWSVWNKERERLKESLKGIEAIQKHFDRTGIDGNPEAYLLSFDDKGRGRVVIANGNPDTAQHTAVYVPGTKASLGNSAGDLGRMVDLWKESTAMPGDPSVSTITWIGYDAPENAEPFKMGEVYPSAGHPSYAWKGGPALTEFLDGTQVAQGGPDASHTTVIGHSYGTTTIGAASAKGGLRADDIVAVASPGMFARRADELDAPHGHVWSEAASFSKDQVPLGGKVAGLGGGDGGILNQVVPSDRSFGANIMETDAQDHGGYFDRDSVSLENQAAVVTGNYDRVKRG